MKLIAEWWAALWPNCVAVSVWTVLLFVWHHQSIKRHITAEHEKTRQASPEADL